MSWESRVCLAKKRIPKKTIRQTYLQMRERFPGPVEEDADAGDEPDTEAFAFPNFVLHLVDDTAGMYLLVYSDEIGHGSHDAEDAVLCMDEWAELLGGAISEEKWSEREERAGRRVIEKRKLPKFGAADTICYFAFDAAGNERGRKSIANELAGDLKPKLLEPSWLAAQQVVCIEYLSYGPDGTVFSHRTHDVSPDGKMGRARDP